MTDLLSPLARALQLTGNKFVEACAGAGKTFALSKRYCKIIDDFAGLALERPEAKRWGVQNILVITFTRKAAAEMAARIYKDLKILLEGGTIPETSEKSIDLGENLRRVPEEYRLWLRSTYSMNYISTIDSFCARILRENAHKIGIDPQFKMEDELQSDRIFIEELKDFWEERSRDRDSDLQILLENSSLYQIRQYFRYLYKNKEFLSEWLKLINSLSAEELKEKWISNYTPKFRTDWLIKELKNLIVYLKCEFKDQGDKGRIFLDRLNDKLKELETIGEELHQWHFIVNQIIPLFLTKSGEYRKQVDGNQANWAVSEECKVYKETVKTLLAELQIEIPQSAFEATPNDDDFRSLPSLKSLVELYLRFEERLSKVKQRLNYLSFNELIMLTHRMLSEHNNIRMKYVNRFKHILIDEFQDTNDLRWEIIRLIASDEQGNLRKEGLFIVGDKKQSIYGFSQADVEVMNHARQALNEVSGDDSMVIDFNRNFRSSREFIDHCLNPIFSKIMPGYAMKALIEPYEVFFEPTEYGARSGEDEIVRGSIGAKTDTCLTIQASYSDEDDSGLEYLPALHTALMVKRFLNWADEVGIREKPAVAVLLRKLTKIHHYQRIFRQYGLPFEIAGGRGLFRQQEAYDLLHLIGVLNNPTDDLALVGLLRSPIFALKDDDIHQLFQSRRKGDSAYSALKKYDNLNFVSELIGKWRNMAQRMPLDRLLEKIISEDCRELGYFSEVSGEQRIANLDRIIGIIHNLSLEGLGLNAVYDYLEYQSFEGGEAPQAEVPSAARVQIMSVHQAKGLQFPAVIIPEMNEVPKSETSPILLGKLNGENMEVGITLTDEREESVKTGILGALKKLNQRKNETEELRLFYVAATRAKYKLALLGDIKANPINRTTWWKRFLSEPGFCPPQEETQAESWEVLSNPEKRRKVNLISLAELKEELDAERPESPELIEWSDPPAYEMREKYLELTPHDLMESVHPAGQFEKSKTTDGYDEIGLAVGDAFHKAVEKGWVEFSRYEEQIADYISNQYSEAEKNRVLNEVKVLLDVLLKSERWNLLSSLPNADKFLEHPLTGWIDNGETFLEVSGRPDLIYRLDEKWYILDFKTDSDKERLPAYTLQLQSYIWMLKQIYGIEADGQIYYARFGETIRIRWEEDYFNRILPQEKHPFRLSKIQSSIPSGIVGKISRLIAEHAGQKIIIINQTKQQAADLLKGFIALKSGGGLTPNVRITTMDELLREGEIPGKKLSPQLARICAHKLLSENSTGKPPRGLTGQLAEALLEQDEGGGELSAFQNVGNSYKELIREKDLYTDRDVMDNWLNEADLEDAVIIINGFYDTRALSFEFIRRLKERAGTFYFLDNFSGDEVSEEFPLQNTVWVDYALEAFESPGQEYTTCFSVDTEVEDLARDILAIPAWEAKLERIKIAVTSMERYIPPLKRIFSGYGIPLQVSKREPISERPVAQLLIGVLKIMENPAAAEWNDIAPVALHPLMKPSPELWELDRWRRKEGISFFSQTEKRLENLNKEKYDSPALRAGYKSIQELLQNQLTLADKRHAFSAAEKLLAFIETAKLENAVRGDPVSEASLKALKDIIEQIPKSYEIVDHPADFEDFRLEFIDRVRETEVPSKEQNRGIEVLGTLDTVHLEPEYLFVLGMTEKQFPYIPEPNPLLKEAPFNRWFLDFALLKRWMKLGERVRYYCPERSESGDSLQPSTFLEYLQKSEPAEITPSRISPREHFRKFSEKLIANPGESNLLLRHNEYLQSGLISDFRGKVKAEKREHLKLSPSSMDELIRCPMRYWFGKILGLKPLRFEEEIQLKLMFGNLVHQTLEDFGNAGGFEMLKDNLENACLKLDDILHQRLAAYRLDIENDMLLKFRLKPLVEGLAEAYENNLLVELLKWNRDNFADFKSLAFEQKFGLPGEAEEEIWEAPEISEGDLRLQFEGKIDKVLINEEAGIILATDYKTGEIDIKDIVEKWSSQFPLYYFALKQKFPDKKVIMAYEQIKSLKKDKHGVSNFAGDLDSHSELKPTSGSEKKNIRFTYDEIDEDIYNLNLGELTSFYAELARKIIAGEFPIAERELDGKACEYCDFEALCRKSCVVL